jgi:hypothetical protein
MKIFREVELQKYLEEYSIRLNQEIQSEDKNKLLNMNESKYIAYLVYKYQIEPLVFFWEEKYVTEYEKMIPAESHPSADFLYEKGEEYSRQIITYHIPYSGNEDLLRCSRSYFPGWSIEVQIQGNEISFDIVNWRDDPEEIKRDAEEIISNIQKQENYIKSEVHGFNSNLENKARQIFQDRKAFILKQYNLVESLGVPFKKAEKVPLTFSVPLIKKKPLIKPSAPSEEFTPEFILDASVYNDILRICHETGVEMERHPSIYFEKDEETLRDYFIMFLSPHFQSVTGETFNKTGKTDILIRHEKSNVFIAECKFWKGIGAFHETIDQILSYLTWRDSKAAILCFVKNKELNPVLEQIEFKTSSHNCFVKYNGKQSDSWFNFEFHLKDDPSRGIKLTILCFHFPSQKIEL